MRHLPLLTLCVCVCVCARARAHEREREINVICLPVITECGCWSAAVPSLFIVREFKVECVELFLRAQKAMFSHRDFTLGFYEQSELSVQVVFVFASWKQYRYACKLIPYGRSRRQSGNWNFCFEYDILRSRFMCLKQMAAPWVVLHGLF